MTYAIESNGYVSNIIMQQYEVVILENAKELGRYLLNNVPFHCFRPTGHYCGHLVEFSRLLICNNDLFFHLSDLLFHLLKIITCSKQ